MKTLLAVALLLCCRCVLAQDNRLWATYTGGNDMDGATGIATDTGGNVFVTGYTKSTSGMASGGFQNTYGGGAYDVFLAKYNASGQLLWCTYYGGSGDDRPAAVATDLSGNVFVTGFTSSSSGIASGGFQLAYGGGIYDAFLVKFNAAGNRVWGTYYGGSGIDGGNNLACDTSGNVYLAGGTDNTVNMAFNGFDNTYGGGTGDALLVKFSPSGSRIWATYYGGSNLDSGTGVSIDPAGNIFLGGKTESSSGIASGGFQNSYGGGTSDAFLVKFDPGGNRIWATYYGGPGMDFNCWPVADQFGNVYLGGITNSLSGIASGGFQNSFAGGVYDAYVARFNSSGNRIWGTYFGGGGTDEPENIAVNEAGDVFLGGSGYSPGLVSGGFQNTFTGSENQFVVKIDSAGNMVCSTYYGQAHEEEGTVAVFGNGIVYLAGATESASGIASGGFQNTYGGGVYDAFLVKFSTCGPPLNLAVTSSDPGCNGSCTGTAVAGVSGGIGPFTYLWNTVPPQTTATASGLCAGTYFVTVTDASFNSIADTVVLTEPPALSLALSATSTLCTVNNGTALAAANGGTGPYTYLWNNADTGAFLSGLGPGIYSVLCTDANGCTITQTVSVNYTFPPPVVSISNDTTVVYPATVSLAASGGSAYTWSPSAGLSCSACPDPIASPAVSTTYCVIASDTNGCTDSACMHLEILCDNIYIPSAFSPNNDGQNDLFFVRSHCLDGFTFSIYDRWGELVFKTTDQSRGWDGTYKGAAAVPGVYVYYLQAQLNNGSEVTRRGNVTLVR